MKKLLIALLILSSGVAMVGSMRVESSRLKTELASRLESSRAQTAALEVSKAERDALDQDSGELRKQLLALRASAHTGESALQIAAGRALRNEQLSPEQSEALLAALGFSWNNPGDCLFVTKQTLHKIRLTSMKGAKLTDAVCGVLAITPAERNSIETLVQNTLDEHTAWMKAHVKRTGPKGNILCEYHVGFDEARSQTVSNAFATHVSSTLGPERSDLLLRYSPDLMRAMSISDSKPTTLTVKENSNKLVPYEFTLKVTDSSMNMGVIPLSPFPEAFKPLFPNGWVDLANAEGFELPKEFQKNKAR